MTYRDHQVALRARVEVAEVEAARLEGELRGAQWRRRARAEPESRADVTRGALFQETARLEEDNRLLRSSPAEAARRDAARSDAGLELRRLRELSRHPAVQGAGALLPRRRLANQAILRSAVRWLAVGLPWLILFTMYITDC